MGVAAVDLGNDGQFDIFVTNLVLETNTLYRNLGGGLFEDRTTAAGLSVPSRPFTGFGLGFRDFDHDGRLDLYVANGRVDAGRADARESRSRPLRRARTSSSGASMAAVRGGVSARRHRGARS